MMMMICHVNRQILKNQRKYGTIRPATELEKVSIFLIIVSMVALILCAIL